MNSWSRVCHSGSDSEGKLLLGSRVQYPLQALREEKKVQRGREDWETKKPGRLSSFHKKISLIDKNIQS